MNEIQAILEDYARQLTTLAQRISQSKTKVPQGSLRIDSNNGNPQYYHMTKKADTYGKYIPKSDSKLISALAQKDYHQKCLQVIVLQQKALSRFIKDFHPEEILAVYSNLKPARRIFTTPILLTDDEFAMQWQAKTFNQKKIANDIPMHLTTKGERVRSI